MLATLPQITRKMDFETPAILKALAEATRYLNTLAEVEILKKARWGRESYYLNTRLIDLLFNIPVIRRGNTNDDRKDRGGDDRNRSLLEKRISQ